MSTPTTAQQLDLLTYCEAKVTPRGDGSWVVTASKPVALLTTAQVAAALGVDGSTVRRWIKQGTIPRDFAEGVGLTRWRLKSEVVDYLRKKSTALKHDGLCFCGVPTQAGRVRCAACDQAFQATVGDSSPGSV